MLNGNAQTQKAPPSNWNGFYFGGHLGNVIAVDRWNDVSSAFPFPKPLQAVFTGGGLVGGLQAGYNHQIGSVLVGLEADASAADIDGTVGCAIAFYACSTTIDALGTVTGRLGYATGDFLFYGKAGGAWLHENLEMTPRAGFARRDVWQGEQLRWGWAVGAGAEYAFTPSVSARLEYNYLSFGHDTLKLAGQGAHTLDVALDQELHLVKLGLNYRLSEARWAGNFVPALSKQPFAWDWSGFYVGLHAGGGWGTVDWKSADGAFASILTQDFPGSGSSAGSIVGGQLGFNHQVGSMVIGGEIDASWSNLDGYAKCATLNAPPDSFTCHTRVDALGTFAGRFGWTSGNLLVYGKTGAAWASEKHDLYRNDTPGVFAGDSARWGYMLGSGFEYAFSPAWSGRFEYNYLDFGTATIAFADQFGKTSNIEIGQRAHLLKMGLNYKIGVDPAVSASTGDLLHVKALSSSSSSDWTIDVGTRYWFSGGKMQKDLYDPRQRDLLNSRLIYSGLNAHSTEAFARFDHRSGLFAKGNFGLGSIVNGILNDEDFPPHTVPYSDTGHPVRDGGLRYGSLDVGYNMLSGPAGQLGGYIGYRYFHQRGRGFGCRQVGPGDVCEDTIPDNILGLTEVEEWRGAALGLNAQLALDDRWRLEVDAAYLPYVDHAAIDNHWLRADINPLSGGSYGWGTQVEAILSYAVTDRLKVGVGGRYWFFTSVDGEVQFPGSVRTSPMIFTSDRYGGFFQASYTIGGPDARLVSISKALPANWAGWYLGSHLGAGVGSSAWDSPFPPGPVGDRVIVGGALGGVQFGINHQIGNVVIGAELAGSLSHIGGTDTCGGGLVPATLAGLNCASTTNGLATLTGRAGYALGQSLLYLKVGGVVASETYTLNSNGVAGGSIDLVRATNPGWTIGGGIEHALDSQWSVNAEYKYLDFGSRQLDFAVPDTIAAVSHEAVDTRRHLLTMGVNYRFGGTVSP